MLASCAGREGFPMPKTFWIWAISVFFLAASVAISAAFILALTGALPLAPSQQAYLDNLTPLEIGRAHV